MGSGCSASNGVPGSAGNPIVMKFIGGWSADCYAATREFFVAAFPSAVTWNSWYRFQTAPLRAARKYLCAAGFAPSAATGHFLNAKTLW
jgi:hypothetical protein